MFRPTTPTPDSPLQEFYDVGQNHRTNVEMHLPQESYLPGKNSIRSVDRAQIHAAMAAHNLGYGRIDGVLDSDKSRSPPPSVSFHANMGTNMKFYGGENNANLQAMNSIMRQNTATQNSNKRSMDSEDSVIIKKKKADAQQKMDINKS